MKQNKPQVNTEGLKLSLLFGAYLVVQFLLLNLNRSSINLALISNVLLICTPVVFYHISKYQVLISGSRSFARIFLLTVNIYIFGALVLAATQYIYYEYVVPGSIQRILEESLKTSVQLFPQLEQQTQQLDLLELINGATFAMAVFQMNLFIGIFLSLFNSAILYRKVKSNPA